MPCSAFRRCGRKIRGSPSISSSSDEPLVSICDNACSTVPSGTSSSFTAASLSRQSTMSVRGRFQQYMVDARPCPIERVSRNPDSLGDLVGGREADPVDVFREHIGIALHLFDCLLAVGLEDAHRPAGAHAVAVQEEHDFANLFCLLPRIIDPLPALGADAVDRLQFG